MTVNFEPEDSCVDEEQIDNLVSFLKEIERLNDADKAYVLNPVKAKMFNRALATVKECFGDMCTITYKRRESVPSTIDVKVSGKVIYIESPRRFTNEVLRYANNFEVVTYNNKMMELNISFSNILNEVC